MTNRSHGKDLHRIAKRIVGLSCVALMACQGDTAPVRACHDFADALAHAAERCGTPYQETYDEFVKTAMCDSIKAIRDEQQLRGRCIPSLATITCADLNAAKLDDTCLKQFIK